MINVHKLEVPANQGCPEVSEEVMKTLNNYGKVILFDSGKSTFQQGIYTVLHLLQAAHKKTQKDTDNLFTVVHGP
jgi:hypothetical protein